MLVVQLQFVFIYSICLMITVSLQVSTVNNMPPEMCSNSEDFNVYELLGLYFKMLFPYFGFTPQLFFLLILTIIHHNIFPCIF